MRIVPTEQEIEKALVAADAADRRWYAAEIEADCSPTPANLAAVDKLSADCVRLWKVASDLAAARDSALA